VDPDRVTKAGARLLPDYLEYAGSGGTVAEASGRSELNPFEADVRDRLAECGITVVPQYGVGGYRVDFAATRGRGHRAGRGGPAGRGPAACRAASRRAGGHGTAGHCAACDATAHGAAPRCA
jgi:hypothetical protein